MIIIYQSFPIIKSECEMRLIAPYIPLFRLILLNNTADYSI